MQSSLTSAAAALSFVHAAPVAAAESSGRKRFKLKYAPHFGMFQNHVGEDPVEQIRFMADQGFQAIEDNGMGLGHEHTRTRGVGLIGMRERAQSLAGAFAIGARPGGGTRIHVTIPLPASVEEVSHALAG